MDSEQKTQVIEIERQFNVSVEELFKAWTEAEHLKQWWHPMGASLTDVKNELKEGGAVEYYVGDSGLEITGTYSEVVPNEKLAYSWVWNMSDEGSESGYKLDITFSPDGEGSKLKVVQEGFSGPEFLKPHEEGWEKGLDDLESYLSSGTGKTDSDAQNSGEVNVNAQSDNAGQDATAQDNLKSAENMTDRSGGYNEDPDQVKVGGG
ncbi:SRPBCC family protein [Dyadobacter chenhuakuii]|uniref:SRPBCC domain-containing protein n=1 Tax=Dyadobacter chenhuakuii TaxID=2909339 RepID=A0A9X1QG70_9BACT|nr:SRPBCC domain-containing protein [Dyadobacter chenhuakuii]MCF2493095.1 SRPBCC domain-containing protein [Dyadobacter chenhuakuii]MCF2499159.1 SRPBCC domain-containing protein [Dyadobacter chenhuakuii]USJ32618.1 SRPBCC domain-containing protein [Dyadobacter chenhuakuii]